jgi:hypothetical protein
MEMIFNSNICIDLLAFPIFIQIVHLLQEKKIILNLKVINYFILIYILCNNFFKCIHHGKK